MPLLHVLSDTSNTQSVLALPGNFKEDGRVLAIRMALERYAADSVNFMHDAWLSEVGMGNQVLYPQASKDPNRKDALIANYCTHTESGAWTILYTKDNGTLRFGEIKLADATLGRLTEWLKPLHPKEITFTQRRLIEPMARQLFNQLMSNRRGA